MVLTIISSQVIMVVIKKGKEKSLVVVSPRAKRHRRRFRLGSTCHVSLHCERKEREREREEFRGGRRSLVAVTGGSSSGGLVVVVGEV